MQRYLIWVGTLPRVAGLVAMTLPVLLFTVGSTCLADLLFDIANLENHILAGVFYSVTITPYFGHVVLKLVAHADRTRNELRRQADSDPLTGLLNRRAFFKTEEEWTGPADIDRANRSVICFDIDHFKAINDQHGHQAGDAVIRHFAAILRANTRRGDLAARFGGEEFVLQAFGATAYEAAQIAERIRQMVESTAVVFDDKVIRYTISAGVVTSTAPVHIDAIIRDADGLLYEAKSRGRNRVCTDRGPAATSGVLSPMPVVVH